MAKETAVQHEADAHAEPTPKRHESVPAHSKFTSLRDRAYVCIYRYNLNTALYMLEPWERVLFNIIILSLLAYIVYGLYYSALHPLIERITSSSM